MRPVQATPPRPGWRGSWVALWIALTCAVAVFCLWPLATNVGFFGTDELDLLDDMQHGQPCFDWVWFARGSGLFYRPLGYALLATQLHVAGGAPTLAHLLSIAHHTSNVALAALLFV